MIHPIPDLCVWNDIEAAHVEPPPLKRKPGRPKLLRKRESHEKPKAARSGSVVCGKCKQPGHNKRTCKAVITSESNKVNYCHFHCLLVFILFIYLFIFNTDSLLPLLFVLCTKGKGCEEVINQYTSRSWCLLLRASHIVITISSDNVASLI